MRKILIIIAVMLLPLCVHADNNPPIYDTEYIIDNLIEENKRLKDDLAISEYHYSHTEKALNNIYDSRERILSIFFWTVICFGIIVAVLIMIILKLRLSLRQKEYQCESWRQQNEYLLSNSDVKDYVDISEEW